MALSCYDARQEAYSVVTEALHDAVYLIDEICCLFTIVQHGCLPHYHTILRGIYLRR
jgi:hypothetical protein